MRAGRQIQRVLMTADTVGGVWTYVVELAAALGSYGIDVAVAAMGEPVTPAQRREVDRLDNVTLFESTFKLEWMEDPWRDVARAGKWLLKVARRFEPDVVHLNNYAHGSLRWPVPAVVVGHSCVLSWWRAVHGQEAPRKYDAYRRAVRAGLAGADAVVAPSATMLSSLTLDYGPFRDSFVVRNGHDPARFRPGDKAPLVFAAGRLWDEAKNMACLVQAAPHINWPVYVAGESRHPDGGQVQLENVRTCGRLKAQEIAHYYAHAAIYAFPARYEPFGLSVLEAALSGCALVLGDIPSLRETWGDAAVFVSPDDHRGLARAINGLVDDQRLRRHMALASRNRALRFTLAAQAAKYVQLYGALCTQTLGARLVAVQV